MRTLFRRLARALGHLLLGGSIALALCAVALFGVGLYLASIPYSRMSKRHAQLLAIVGVAQAGAALLAAVRQPEDEGELAPEPAGTSARI
jgi:4-amino-4-deoxy-L-arabinose transferase-like glycosyltransferase